LSKPRAYIAAISAGNKIFFAGGVNLSLEEEYDIVDIYDVTTNTWTVEHLSQARGGAVAALVGNKILFIGGWYDGFWAGSRDVDIYDLSGNSWSTATLCVQRWWPAAVTVGNKVYIAGGEGMENNRRDVDVYDNATNTWSKATLAQNHDGLSAVASGNNIYWAYDGKVEIWNTLNGTSRFECLSSASPAPAARVIGDEVVFIGGESSTSSRYNRLDSYNQSANTWSMAFLNPDFFEPAVISHNNKLIIAGGNALWRNASSYVYELSW
jgi:N-acetylneuraminic acid mutarotase